MHKLPKELRTANLHVHSDRSDGFSQIHQNVAAAKEGGLYALAISDHGTCSGEVAHSICCKENGIVPVLGTEIYLRLPEALNERSDNSKSGRYHLTILSSGSEGYERLIALNNMSHRNMEIARGIKYPIATFDMLKEVAGNGLIILSGCVASPSYHQEITISYEFINFLIKTFGKSNVYAEIQPHVIHEHLNSYERPLALAKKFNLQTVWTTDAHAAKYEDLALLEIYTKATKGYSFSAGWIQSADQMFQEAVRTIGYDAALESFRGIDEIVRRIEADGIMEFKHHFELPPAEKEVELLIEFWHDALEKDLANGN